MSKHTQALKGVIGVYGRAAFYGALWGGAFGVGAVAARYLIHGSKD